MSANNMGRQPRFRTRYLALIIALHCIMPGIICGQAWAEDYFNPALLEVDNPGMEKADLSFYEKGPGLSPGKYSVDIYINNEKKETQEIRFIAATDKDGAPALRPCLSLARLKSLGVKVESYPALNDTGDCVNLEAIPSAAATLDLNHQALMLTLPQTALVQRPRGYVAPEEFDEGITAFLLNYSLSGQQDRAVSSAGHDRRSDYLSLRPGLNVGPWRLRHYATLNREHDVTGDSQEFNTVYSYLSRDLVSLKSQLMLGQSTSPAGVFDSIPFTGAQLASEEEMLPDSQQGYAPVVRGIAHSNAQVVVRQHGYIISQVSVAPGAFTLTDLYAAGNGDLDVTIKESDGSEQHTVVPYTSVPLLQRQGHVKYSLTGGRYRSYDDAVTPSPFVQGSAIYGLAHELTLYGGVQYSPVYRAVTVGAGKNLGEVGALSLDVTSAAARLPDGASRDGRALRVRYGKTLTATGTSVSVAGYRYNSAGFYSMQDTFDAWRRDDVPQPVSHRRSREEVSVNQNIGDNFGSLNLSLVRERYWEGRAPGRSLNLGYNNNWQGITYSLNYSVGDTDHGSQARTTRERSLALTVSIPLERWLPNTWASYSLNHNRDGATQTLALNGSALAQNNLNWSVQQSRDASGADSRSLNVNYRGAKGSLGGSYSRDRWQQTTSYSLQGGVVMHADGVTFSQPLGETVALVKAPGASGTRINNQTGVKTDGRGYTVVPYVSPYRHNTIGLNTETLPDNADITQASQTVTPTRGAVVRATFATEVGARALIRLQRPDGKPVPFGATVVKAGEDEEFIVGEDGEVWLTGLSPQGTLNVSWGALATTQCTAAFHLPATAPADTILTLSARCQ
ncbi:fimbrial biogenesis outer membrane usher protein [Cronobacter dublinensis]|nr:fimbrial biogenesis outer membrane usher protein [Cronobacter dublinensis]EMA8656003.1 fimbrial biogenesis outer membrane usher protein [Cronobacter dublinensis]